MKVLLQSRIDLFDKRGGDTIHLEKTKEALEKLGVRVNISLKNNPDLFSYDLVHLFNLDWVRDTYLQSLNAKRQKKKVVLTPIHHRFSEIEAYEKKARFGLRRLVNPLCRSYERREQLKNIYRAFFDSRKRTATLTQLRLGISRQQREVLKLVDLVLPNTRLEDQEIRKEFGVKIQSRVVPAGVAGEFAAADPTWFKEKFGVFSQALLGDFVLSVGRIEPRKNQLRIIEALEGSGLPLVLVGEYNKLHLEYAFRFKRKVARSENTFHIEKIPYDKISSAFAAAKVHVLASFFETTGLVNLEAALTGANVVSTNRGYCREYLKEYAWYVNPESTRSIKAGIIKAFAAPRNDKIKGYILKNYSWEKVGEETLRAYEEVLS